MREYCYWKKVAYPYTEQEDMSYNPQAVAGPPIDPHKGSLPFGHPNVPDSAPTLPPPAESLPNYDLPPADTQPVSWPSKGSIPKSPDGDDEDDADLMARLKNLQD